MTDAKHAPPKSHLPWRRRLHYRLIVNYGALFIVVLSLLMAIVINTIYSVQIDQAEHDLEVRALLAANSLEDPLSGYSHELEDYEHREYELDSSDEDSDDDDEDDDHKDDDHGVVVSAPGTEGLQHLADRYAEQDTLWVTIIDVRGDPVVDSRGEPDKIANQFGAPEIQAALNLVEQHDVRVDPSTGDKYLFTAAPVQIRNQLLGIVRIAQPMRDVLEPIRALALDLLLAGAAALILATVLGFWIAGRLVQPIRKLEETALAVASGDLSQTADIQSEDEIGSLARTFDYMVRELQEMMRRQRFFIANASHELRTPLTNIKLRSEALLELADEDPALTTRYLQEIDSEADRMGRLATVMLDLSRMDNSEPAPPETPVDIQPMLLSVVQSIRLRVQNADLDFILHVDEALPPLTVRVDELETIVLNLLDNAIKYTPAGGSVELRAEREMTMDKPGVTIAVCDSGPGIPSEDVDRIFEYFYRVDKARSRQSSRADSAAGSGSGLGLAIVQKLVSLNGGQIRVSSVENQGTTFTVSFPFPNN